ncbi:hypothetical protein [Streptomyces sp.]|uniref:hypothetical protein n=1 Tax=Streptomyces sp. TaxID=1931 RepID=UPI002F92FA5B
MTPHLVPPLPVTETRRDQLETLAEHPVPHLPQRLAELSPLPEDLAMEWFEELCEAVCLRDAPWPEIIPDAVGTCRDEQADDYIRDRIEAALDKLEGGRP